MYIEISSNKDALSNFDLKDLKLGKIYVKTSDTLSIGKDEFKFLNYPVRLELHIKSSETVGLPILADKYLSNSIELKSNSLYKPIQGTNNSLSFKIVGTNDIVIPADTKIIEILLVSRTYWEQLLCKNTDGIRSVSIGVIWHLIDTDEYILCNMYKDNNFTITASSVDGLPLFKKLVTT
jgi:hypothetical protein